MNGYNRILVSIVIALLFVGAIIALVNRPRVPTAPEDAALPAGDPLRNLLLTHMVANGALTADRPSTETLGAPPPDLTVEQKGDKIHILLSEEFIHRLGPNALIDLSMTEPEAFFSRDRYLRFLDDLHKLIVTLHPEIHEHDHHSEDEHESERGHEE